jgi:hypothetical protein
MSIKSNFPIYKLSDSVFQIGDINYDSTFIKTISDLLSLGNKFVPNYFHDKTQYLQFILRDIDLKILDFNRTFFVKSNSIKKQKNLNQDQIINKNKKFAIIDDNYFEQMIKFMKNKKHIDYDKLYLNNEVKEFRLNIHKKLLDNFDNINIKPNITLEQLKAIITFQKNKPFKIIDCDKNVGLALISNELYKENVKKFLNEDKTYSKLSNNPLDDSIIKINESLNNLFKFNHISIQLLNKLNLKPNENKLGSFRLLAKLHKPDFSWRPIINCRNNPTSKICNFLDKLLKPLVENTETFIKDSQNLIQKCQDMIFETKPMIYSMDFTSLYSKMNHTHTANTITDYIKDFLDTTHLTAFGLRSLILIILNYNYFKYEEDFYKQLDGMAMGVYAMYDKTTKKLKFWLYTKPTNNFSYLLNESNHPESIFKNIPMSLFIRNKRICTNYSDFLAASYKTTIQLLKRKFCMDNIVSAFNVVRKINREELLPYKFKNDFNSHKTILFFNEFNYNLYINNIIYESFSNTKIENLEIKIVNKIATNINRLFVHNFKITNFYINQTYKCNTKNCMCCNFIYNQPYVELKDVNFKLPLLNNGNCLSKNIIYIIICTQCNIFYVGETSKTLKERIYQHLYKIKKFKAFKKNICEVSIHFNTKFHYLSQFKVCIFKENLSDSILRKSEEKDLINFLNLYKTRCINSFISFNIKKFAFS